MRRAAYLFESKSIQAHLRAGGRLRDAVGASAVIDSIAGDAMNERGGHGSSLLDHLLRATAGGADAHVLRRAAGAFRLIFSGAAAVEKAKRFCRLTRLALPSIAPGLDFVDAVGEGDDAATALADAQAALLGRRGLSPRFEPPTAPIAERAPRTGTAAVGTVRDMSDPGRSESADAPLISKRRMAGATTLLARFVERERARPAEWPYRIEDLFASYDGARIVGVVHADGNRLGAVVRAMSDRLGCGSGSSGEALSTSERRWIEAHTGFSTAIAEATRGACIRATDTVVVPARVGASPYPMRPLIQAGDDVTVLLRGDLALRYAEVFLTAFEELSDRLLGDLFERHGLGAPPPLSACAGIALVGEGQPFTDAHDLAEDLCGFAKERAKATCGREDRVPSAIAFHRVASSLVRSWSDISEGDLKTPGAFLTLGPYGCPRAGQTSPLPGFGALRDLADVVRRESFRRGPLRELATLLYDAPAEAGRKWVRIRKILEKEARDDLEAFEKRLAALTGEPIGAGLVTSDARSPLADLLAIVAIDGRTN